MADTENAAIATALIIDGAYAEISGNKFRGEIDYLKLRSVLEELCRSDFKERWYFTHSRHQYTPAFFTMLKSAPPHGPQFQLKMYGLKAYACHCKRCHYRFDQWVQKGVDNGIATKLLSLAYENICERFLLFAGDGDFYDSLNHVKNVLRKDFWVVGFRDNVSADLQQLASTIIWLDDHWQDIKKDSITKEHFNPHPDPQRRNHSRHAKNRSDVRGGTSSRNDRHTMPASRSRSRPRRQDGKRRRTTSENEQAKSDNQTHAKRSSTQLLSTRAKQVDRTLSTNSLSVEQRSVTQMSARMVNVSDVSGSDSEGKQMQLSERAIIDLASDEDYD